MSSSFSDLFASLTLGVYVVGVASEGEANAFTAAWVMPVSFDPPLLAISIHPDHRSYELLIRGGGFSVNVLRADQQAWAAHFGRSTVRDKLAGFAWELGANGAPRLSEVTACLECGLKDVWPSGDHRLVVGEVISGFRKPSELPWLTYADTDGMDGAAALFPERSPESVDR